MSAADPALPAAPDGPPLLTIVSHRRLARFEGWLERMGERLNPILVKECRQALKSRQFTVTFALLLIAGWICSIAGVAKIGPSIRYGVHGPEMFFNYFVVLSFPLLLIVPFGTFWSLAGEREDRTFELLSITTLRPRQIIGGKLGSALVQMVVYFSAISPCLAFTYLLRGIDVLTILFIMYYLLLASLGFSLLGILLATITGAKHWHIVLAVVSILGLFWAFVGACNLCRNLLDFNRLPFDDPDFWIAQAAILTAYVSYFVLLFQAAAAQVTFVSDNRSTPLRITMLVQHVLFAGWMGWAWVKFDHMRDVEFLVPGVMLLGIHWWFMGAFMAGENSQLSPRVRRQLPQSFLGRVFLTWFNPGPGTGYIFVLANLLGGIALMLVALGISPIAWSASTPYRIDAEHSVYFALTGFCYVVIYLGLGNLIVRLLRRVMTVSMPLAFLVNFLLVVLGVAVPMLIESWTSSYRSSYSLLQLSNFGYTLVTIAENRVPINAPEVLAILSVIALLVFVFNLRWIAAEVREVRIAVPQRVREEDAQMAPAVPAQPLGPWD